MARGPERGGRARAPNAGELSSVHATVCPPVVRQAAVDRIQDITARSVKDAFLLLKEKGLSSNTIRIARSVLRQLLGSAVEDGIIPNNPVLEIRRTRSKGKKQKVRAMTWAQREKFISTMHKKNVIAVTYQAAFDLAFMTGIRPGELWALRTTDVDLETRKLRVERAKETKSTRTHEQREVDLSPSTVEMMGSYLAWRREWCLQGGKASGNLPEASIDTDWLFPNEAGGLIDHDGAVKRFNRVLKSARLQHSAFMTRATPTRRFFSSDTRPSPTWPSSSDTRNQRRL